MQAPFSHYPCVRSERIGLLLRSLAILLIADLLQAIPQDATDVVRTARAGQEKSAGEKTDAGKTKAEKKKPPIFHLRDGGKIAGLSLGQSVTVETKYGELEVPLEDLVQIRFSRRIDSAVKEKVEQHLEAMGSDDFDQREEAMGAIREIGSDALPQLRSALESDNEEVKNRAEILIEELEEERENDPVTSSAEVNPLKGVQDEVITRRFTIRGRVTETEFRIQSRYGELTLSVADLVGIFFQHGGTVSTSLKIEGSKAPPNNWLKTKVSLIKGQPLRIRASGQCTISNYNMTGGPKGTTRYSTTRNFQQFASLALVGKIGKKGKAFLVGEDYRGKAGTAGILYLGVVPYRTYLATGQYKVKVTAGN